MIYTIANIATGLFESIVTFMLFGTFFEKRDNFPKCVYPMAVIVFTLLINFSNILFKWGWMNVVFILLCTFIASNLYKGNLKTKLIISLGVYMISLLIEMLVLLLIIALGGFTGEEVISTPALRLLGIVISKTIYFSVAKIVTKIILIKRKQMSFKAFSNYWILFFTMLFSIILSAYLLFVFQYNNEISYMNVLVVIDILGLMYSFIFTMYLYEKLSVQAEEIANKKVLEQQLKSQSKHVDEIFASQKKIMKMRHDLSNHLIAMRAYMEDSKCEEGLKYIDKISHDSQINEERIDTGNMVLDTILTAKRDLAFSKGISISMDIRIPQNLKLDPADMCVVFGNIFDNAIEACEKVDDKRIDFSFIYKDYALICNLTNSAPKEKNHGLKTTKKDSFGHGIGLSNVKAVLNKYDSLLNIEQEEEKFILSFAIFR